MGLILSNPVFFVVKVSQNIIKKSGGLHRHDQGTEVLIPKNLWEFGLANEEIFILGKVPESKIDADMKNYVKTMLYNSSEIESKQVFKDDEE